MPTPPLSAISEVEEVSPAAPMSWMATIMSVAGCRKTFVGLAAKAASAVQQSAVTHSANRRGIRMPLNRVPTLACMIILLGVAETATDCGRPWISTTPESAEAMTSAGAWPPVGRAVVHWATEPSSRCARRC